MPDFDFEEHSQDNVSDSHRSAGLVYFMRYFDARVGTFEKAMQELRTDLKEQAQVQSNLLTRISDKLESRMDAQEVRMDKQDDRMDKSDKVTDGHTTFIGAVKWVLAGTASLAALAIANTIPSFLHPNTQTVYQSIPQAIHHFTP